MELFFILLKIKFVNFINKEIDSRLIPFFSPKLIHPSKNVKVI